MTDRTSIYNLKLHESVEIGNGWTVMRVPGGWIYRNYYHEATCAFVPLNNEFQGE
jgi:hypothetical protein